MLKSAIISVIFSALLFSSPPHEIERGTLLLDKHPKEVMRYIDNGHLDLETIRATCNFLTDPTIQTYRGDSIPKRKNAVVRHIKQISNSLEMAWEAKIPVNDSIMEMLYEIAWYEKSLQDKTYAASHTVVNFNDQLCMWLNTQRSNTIFSVPIRTGHAAAISPPASPFWHPANPEVLPQDRFDELAKLKKIKAKKKMVVVFDEFSYDGSAPKISTLDTDMDNGWVLKWGDEVHTDVLCSRLFAALGYDVDHPYFYGRDSVTLIFPKWQPIQDADVMKRAIQHIYHIDISAFIHTAGIVDQEMISNNKDLSPYAGATYVTFIECALEARPDRVKRIGSFTPDAMHNDDRRSLRGALLAQAWIGNWDTRESNTLLTQVHMGNYQYRASAVFSDLGTSMGVATNTVPPDFKTGLVNTFSWDAVHVQFNRIFFNEPMNAILPPYANADYDDLLWMAGQIALIDSSALAAMVQKAGWPEPLEKLFFYKMASRRASILNAFQITDPHPIYFDKQYSATINGQPVIRDGKLIAEIDAKSHPESFLKREGRLRNYGR